MHPGADTVPRTPGRPHRHILVVAAVTFIALLVSAGLRATPGVLLVPLQLNFGWDRAIISVAAAVGIFLYGMVGPFAAALTLSIGIRRTMLGGLALMGLATFASLWMTAPWHYLLTWGVLSGFGTGAVRQQTGSYVTAFVVAGAMGLLAACVLLAPRNRTAAS